MDDDSFFDNFFGGMTEKPLTLHTDGSVVKIKALPTGRPAGFSGAVGISISPPKPTPPAEDRRSADVENQPGGHGNFDRVTTDGLPASADWKSYKPTRHLLPATIAKPSALKPSSNRSCLESWCRQEIPAVSFSYFDPETETYVTKKPPRSPSRSRRAGHPIRRNAGAAVPAMCRRDPRIASPRTRRSRPAPRRACVRSCSAMVHRRECGDDRRASARRAPAHLSRRANDPRRLQRKPPRRR